MKSVFLLRRLIGITLLLVASKVVAADLYVITHTTMELKTEEIKEIFLGEVQFLGSIRILPIDNASAHADFLARVLKLPAARYSALWTKKAFRDGLNAPPLKGTDSEVIAFVRSHPGAIGYVSTLAGGVSVLGKF